VEDLLGPPLDGSQRGQVIQVSHRGEGIIRTLTGSQRAILEREYANMLACVRCGACLTSCPTYVLTSHEAEGPRGRVAMVRAVLEDGLGVTPDFLAHQASCLVCDACTTACPAGVKMDPLQIALRAAVRSPSFGNGQALPSWPTRAGCAF
jgi:L-lactate utilization protein LutB